MSHATALSVVLVHYFALAFGLYLLARCWVSPLAAIAVGLSVMAAPGIALLGTPGHAGGALGRLRGLGRPDAATSTSPAARPGALYLAIVLLLCATYTKITTIFLFPVFALVLLVAQGPGVLRERRTWIVAGLTIVGLLPLIYLTMQFGSANVQSVVGIPDAAVSRNSIAGWIWYARQLPWQLGWPLLALAILIVPLAAARKLPERFTRSDRVLTRRMVPAGLPVSVGDRPEGGASRAGRLLPPVLLAAG